MVLLSETHWNPSFNVKFRNYIIFKKDGTDRQGGGVAILVSSALQFSSLANTPTSYVEAFRVSVFINYNEIINFVSVYVPNRTVCEEDVQILFPVENEFGVGGDFKVQHEVWSNQSSSSNRSVRCVYQTLIDHPHAILLTTPNLSTRVNPSTGKSSTTDLTIISLDLAVGSTIATCPTMGSNHFHVLFSFQVTTIYSPLRVPR